MTRREEDSSKSGFKQWTFNTVHFWGTNPNGEFILLLEHNVRFFTFFPAKIYGRTVCQHDIQLFCGDLCIGFPIMLTTNVWPQNIDAFLYGTDLLTFGNKQLYIRGLIFKGLRFERLV